MSPLFILTAAQIGFYVVTSAARAVYEICGVRRNSKKGYSGYMKYILDRDKKDVFSFPFFSGRGF
jgi:hypothetical protein